VCVTRKALAREQRFYALIEKPFFGLFPGTAAGTDAGDMFSLLVTGLPKSNRIIQILSVINCRFLGPNSR
jgi:hypothetical protein